MGGKKKATQQQQQTQSHNSTTSYGWQNVPETSDIKAVRDFQFTADPAIGYAFGSAKNKIADSFSNPIGGYYSPQMRDKILQSSLSNLAQQEAQAKSEAHHNLQGQVFGQRATVASMTNPRLVSTGSSGTGTSSGTNTTTQGGDLLGQIIGGASTAAMMALAYALLLGVLVELRWDFFGN